MRLVIGDESYDLFGSVKGAGIGDLRDLRKITKGLLDSEDNGGVAFQGVTPKTFTALFEQMNAAALEKAAAVKAAAKAGTEPPADEDDPAFDDRFYLHMQALVWLARRKDGQRVTFDDCNVPVDGFTFEPDPEDLEVDDSAPKDDPAEG